MGGPPLRQAICPNLYLIGVPMAVAGLQHLDESESPNLLPWKAFHGLVMRRQTIGDCDPLPRANVVEGTAGVLRAADD
jgi:hypothetical protein